MTDSFRLHVHVDQEHITYGDPFDCYSCPLARAIQEAAFVDGRTVRWVQVGGAHAAIRLLDDRIFEAALPNTAVDFIDTFDEHGKADPIELDLEFFEFEDDWPGVFMLARLENER